MGQPVKKSKTRLDRLLVERGLAKSRTRAQSLVMSGRVYSATRRLDKPGMSVAVDTPICLKAPDHPWASRGGVKLAHGLNHFRLNPSGLVCLDVGASAGGFTDVLVGLGAARVYAVDVGHGQLAWRLREDDRVVVLERTNVRVLTPELIPEAPGLIVCDVSFIGLRTALPRALDLAPPGAHLVALIKPQFEVGKGRVGKGGVVRDSALHREVTENIRAWIEGRPGWSVQGVTESPIEGADGNKEFLIAARLEG